MTQQLDKIPRLKFEDFLTDLILAGAVDTTWRIDDERDLGVGDIFIVVSKGKGLVEIAIAEVLWVKYTTIDRITMEDKAGHYPIGNTTAICEKMSEYYEHDVLPGTEIKVIKFNVVEEIRG